MQSIHNKIDSCIGMTHSKGFRSRFVSDESEFSTRILQPIAGYEKAPLVSLREACQPLETILNEELHVNIAVALKNCEKPKDGLTRDESAAIYLYTMSWQDQKNSLYHILNGTLREERRNKLEPWHRYLKLLLTALFKLP